MDDLEPWFMELIQCLVLESRPIIVDGDPQLMTLAPSRFRIPRLSILHSWKVLISSLLGTDLEYLPTYLPIHRNIGSSSSMKEDEFRY